jgi:hypothetical protein
MGGDIQPLLALLLVLNLRTAANGDRPRSFKTAHFPHLRGLIIASIAGIKSLEIELLET